MKPEKISEPTIVEALPETISSEGSVIDSKTRWQRLQEDPDFKEALPALLRTCLNLGISIADFFPGAGAVPSWAADALKFSGKFDLTPSVSKKIAIGSEILDLIACDFLPTHILETILQLKREDLAKLKRGLKSAIKILRSEETDYQANKSDIDSAIDIFK